MRVPLITVALALIALAVLVFRMQANAKNCAHHSHRVGKAAVALAWGCVVGAIALLGYALFGLPEE